MSLIFWDDYLNFGDLHKKVKKIASSREEQDELMCIIDELTHHRLMDCILSNLNEIHHQEFLVQFSKNPSDENLTHFLKERIKTDFSLLIKIEVEKLKEEISSLIHI